MAQRQSQQPGAAHGQKQEHKGFSKQRITAIIIAAFIVTLAIVVAQVLSFAMVIPAIWGNIASTVVGAFGMVFAFFALLPPLLSSQDREKAPAATQEPSPIPQPTPVQPKPVPASPISGPITGSFPPTDPKTIQQRRKLVEEVYTELTKPDINCLVLTGIGGIGKSTAAALLYKYAEEQRKDGKGPFAAEALWITVEETTATFAYLAETISAVLGKPLADFGKLPPQNQAAALFKVLNTPDHSCLIVVNQFENLLDSQTGQANDPGLGEWLDILNSRLCRFRVLLTSRLMPRGTRKYLATYMHVFPAEGLKIAEGVELLRSQGVGGREAELEMAVRRCAGHAYALVLLIALVQDDNVSLAALLKDAALWTGGAGEVAINLLDAIYRQLNDTQRELLRAFSVYREPVPLEAAQVVLTMMPEFQVLPAFKVLRTQYLIQSPEKDCYQLHAIVTDYVWDHFDEDNEQANWHALQEAHAKAAQYYMQQAETNCPPREKRRKVDDVSPLIEAFWQYCQAGQWQEAYDLMLEEGLFADLGRWGRNVILLELCQLLLPSQNWQPEASQAARIYIELGSVYNALGKKQEALSYFEQALAIRREVGDRGGEGNTLNNLGAVYDALGKKQEALSYYEQALAIHREVGDRGGEGQTLNNLGSVYNALGKKQEALSYFEQALAIYREVGDRGGEGQTLNNLGGVYDALGKKQEALSYYEQALAIHQEVEDRGGEGTTLNNLGAVYDALGKKQEALSYYEQALAIYREVGDRGGEGNTLNNLGGVYNALGKKQEALSYYEQALAIYREVGDRGGEGATLYNMGALYFEKGHYDVALASLLLARDIFEEVQSPHRDGVQSWIDGLHKEVGEEQFTTLLAQVEPHASQIVERALHERL